MCNVLCAIKYDIQNVLCVVMFYYVHPGVVPIYKIIIGLKLVTLLSINGSDFFCA